MPKPKKGQRLGGSASHQRKILSNLAAQLIEHEAIKTTDTKAKLLRPYVEKIITKAISGTLADRRNVLKLIPNKNVVNYLFEELAPRFEGRPGGYTRIIKLENRKGDNAPMSQISFVFDALPDADARAQRVAAQQKADQAKDEDKADEAEEAPVDKTTATDADADADADKADTADKDDK
ncbi:50S ribosomal protein L17 [Corynebacterium mendelii]|uniref:Large ribosomal subunit protein bL17 n=1 Tax=Corynebacterium mendelii TaxID=2765362 RepID=A0A939E220_9CORY|nr:50S ribosomal protein L17 [Corynebacterium mendelii]MBN9644027.1 50S ribosomal protein L17 [Corynebacterium mendelii]